MRSLKKRLPLPGLRRESENKRARPGLYRIDDRLFSDRRCLCSWLREVAIGEENFSRKGEEDESGNGCELDCLRVPARLPGLRAVTSGEVLK